MHTNNFESISTTDLNNVTGGGPGGIVKGAGKAWDLAKKGWNAVSKGADVVNAAQSVWDAGKNVAGKVHDWWTGGNKQPQK